MPMFIATRLVIVFRPTGRNWNIPARNHFERTRFNAKRLFALELIIATEVPQYGLSLRPLVTAVKLAPVALILFLTNFQLVGSRRA